MVYNAIAESWVIDNMVTEGWPSPRATAAAIGGLVCALVASPALLAPEYLYFFDSVNFALALEDFDPGLHQPQPPGYALFVLFTRLLNLVMASARAILITAGSIASLAAVGLVWMLGRNLVSFLAANRAALLMLFHPTFWFGALTNQVRVFLAAGSAALMLAAWRSTRQEDPR